MSGHVFLDLKPAGQTYIRYGNCNRHVKGYILKYRGSWKNARRTCTKLRVCGLIEDVSDEYMFDKDLVMENSEYYFTNRFKSNDVLSLKYMKNVVPYFTMAFCRFYQRREAHHGILTYGCAGIPELKSHHITSDIWTQCCHVFMKMSGFDERRFLSMYPDFFQNDAFVNSNGCENPPTF